VHCARKFQLEKERNTEIRQFEQRLSSSESPYIIPTEVEFSRAGDWRCQPGRVELFTDVPDRRDFGRNVRLYTPASGCVRVVVGRPVFTTVGRVGRVVSALSPSPG